jgi:methionyl-tRNA formyltransferase
VSSIDWNKPAQEVYNFVRGCDPQPGARAVFNKEKMRFYGAKLIEAPIDKTPGTILQIDDEGMHVAALGAKLIIGKIKSDKGKKMPANEFANQEGLKPGDRIDI